MAETASPSLPVAAPARLPHMAEGAESWPLLRRLLREQMRPHAARLLAAALLMAVAAAATAASAWLLDPAIEKIFLDKDRRMLWAIPAAVVAVMLVKAFASYGESVLMNMVGQRIIADIQIRVFASLMRADLAWVHETHSGKLLANFLHDAALLREAVGKVVTGIAKDALTLALLAAVMFYQDWRLALIATVVFPAVGVFVRRIGRRMRKASHRGMTETGTLSRLVSENLRGLPIVRAYGREEHEIARVAASIQRRLDHIMKAVRTRSAASPFTEALSGIGIAGAILYAGWQGIEGRMELSGFVSFLAAMMLAYQPLKSLATMNTALQEGLAAAARSFALLDLPRGPAEAADATPLRLSGGTLRFEDVHFAYNGTVPALRGITLEVPAGQTVALVGPSGAGKSTLFHLLLRFHDPDSGRITIDGQDIRHLRLDSLRQALGLVTQEPVLFDDTVRANIAYGRPEARAGEIEAAALAADAAAFIAALPGGYDTAIGEAGVRLSGGQRQRLAIARAMLRDAPILLLDEATSALDAESERQIQAALRRLMRGRTTLVIAHRLSTVIAADLIHVIDRGRVVESGRHGDLLARGGLYARLHRTQFAPDEPPHGPTGGPTLALAPAPPPAHAPVA